ncbi:MAG: carbohydrate-binding family 9-like protein [Phycisphaerales bacterium]|jgi:hypothetical protein|nr:carbohydrate-binding family 9-like protein [Phycisphaerales bacterium]
MGCAATGPQIDGILPKGHPRVYVAGVAEDPPCIDGSLEDVAWRRAAWTADFVDIEGGSKPPPRLRTRAKMCWDAEYFYVAAELDEPHLWSTLTERDSIIYHDNDFEIFIDPDGDRFGYVEYEINTLGTEMDLRMDRPYRNGGVFDLSWDFDGVRSAVALQGTVNDASDRDQGWTVEIAIPWASMADSAGRACPPRPGETWWVNFSRVQWPVRVGGVRYVKPEGAREDNWVWSPQYAIDMHRPEYWGNVQFSADAGGAGTYVVPADAAVRMQLRHLINARERYRSLSGGPPETMADLAGLWTPDESLPPPTIRDGPGGSVMVQRAGNAIWTVDRRGKIRRRPAHRPDG